MATRQIDISCDMGEDFGTWRLGATDDEGLMKLISSASIATGFHAGDPNLINLSVKRAVDRNVAIGAHPGFHDLVGFGRRRIIASDTEIVNDIVYQIGALREFATRHGAVVQHVKPHGAMYMELASNESASRLFVTTLRDYAPDLIIYCMGASATYRVAKELGHPVVREFYADREYDHSGQIVFIRKPDAYDPRQAAERVVRAVVHGKVRAVDGQDIDMPCESVCVHSDTPGSIALLQAIHEAFAANEIEVVPPARSKSAAQLAA